MAEVKRLSASKVTCYMGCAMAYYLNYVKHEKTPTNVRLAFGKDIHYKLEEFYKKNFKSDESFGKSWKWYWYRDISGDGLKGKAKRELEVKEYPFIVRDKETGERIEKILRVGDHVNLGPEPVGVFFGYMKLGERILRNFYLKHKNRLKPAEVEFAFGRKKDDIVKIGDHEIAGVLDRVDKLEKRVGELNPGYYITDYKTDKKSPYTEDFAFNLHRHPQFSLYSAAFRTIFGEEEQGTFYYHLREGKRFITHRSEKDFDYIKELLDHVAEGISNDKFTPFYGFHCSFCDQKVNCEKYTVEHHGGPRIDKENKIKTAREFDEWDVELPEWMEMRAQEI